MAMKMVGDLMNMGNEERVSKVTSRFTRNQRMRELFSDRNPNHAIYLPVKNESDSNLNYRDMVTLKIHLLSANQTWRS